MVTSYKATNTIVKEIGSHIANTNKARWIADRHHSDTARILKWVHSLFIFAAFLAGGELYLADATADHVQHTPFLVGNFVALMATMFKYDAVILAIFSLFDDLNVGFVHVEKIASLVNALTHRKVRNIDYDLTLHAVLRDR